MINKMISNDVYSYYFKSLEHSLRDCESVLDVACGNDSPLRHCKKTFHSTGFDIFEPYLLESKEKGIHDDYIVSDVAHINKKIERKSYDAVVALDLIEHLPKNAGFKLLENLESIARKKVIIFTPNGFLKQTPFDNNPWQEHQSGWSVDDFEKQGYRVEGHGGWKPLRGERSKLRFRPHFFWSRISFISHKLFSSSPKSCFQLFCVKKFDKESSGKSSNV